MAEKLAGYEFTGPGRRAGSEYPWDEWTDGSHWRAIAGDDFQAKPESFRATLYRIASKRDLDVRTEIERDANNKGIAVIFKFTKGA